MRPLPYIQNLKEYNLVSHKAWTMDNGDPVLKLDWNEGDTELPASIRVTIMRFLSEGRTNWYPDLRNQTLLDRLASYTDVPVDHIQYFEGSDCALDCVVRTFANQRDEVVLAAPTYDNFRVYVESVGAIPKHVFCASIFAADIGKLAESVSSKTKIVYIVNPNNPTGVLYSRDDIDRLATSSPNTLIIVDEAYAEFSGTTALPLVMKHRNLLVTRSFSKAFGLASFRLGYIVSAPENIKHIDKIRNGKNISMLAQIAGCEALAALEYMHRHVEAVRHARSFTLDQLTALGFEVRNTPANYILLKTSDTGRLCRNLEQRNVFIRNLNHLPHMDGFVRITIGSLDSMRRFIAIMKDLATNG